MVGAIEPFILQLLAFGLLVAALLAFLLSTLQIRLPARAFLWASGAALIVGAFFSISRTPGHYGLVAALASIGSPGSVLSQALHGNWSAVGEAVAPMFDVFWALGVALAILALVAFTPGEAVERVTKRLMTALLGAVAGGFLALALVAAGFGGYQKRQVYFAVLQSGQVLDGDTIEMGDMRLRLAGIDAPELQQTCLRGSNRYPCGAEARDKLYQFVRGRIVVCGNPDGTGERPIAESFGRPVVGCRAEGNDGRRTDLAGWMIREGLATPFAEESGSRAPDYSTVTRRNAGIWRACTLAPHVWRTDLAARRAFERFGILPTDAAERIGDCPAPVVAAAPPMEEVEEPPAPAPAPRAERPARKTSAANVAPTAPVAAPAASAAQPPATAAPPPANKPRARAGDRRASAG